MISKDTIDRVFQDIRIEDVVKEFVELNRKGANFIGRCPFHDEKTPSFTVSPAKGIYKCFGCGKGGNSINFLMEYKHLSFPEAIRFAAAKLNIIIEEEKVTPQQKLKIDQAKQIKEFNAKTAEYYHKQLFLAENALAFEYVNSRFSLDTIQKWKIGFAPGGYTNLYNIASKQNFSDSFLLSTGLVSKSKKNNRIYDFFQNRIIFPVWDSNDDIISFSGRVLPYNDNGKFAKYFNLKETIAYSKSNVLFGFNFAIEHIAKSKTCVLVEGNPDCVKLHQIGVSNAVATSGTALTNAQIKLINRFADRILLLYDGDSAGQTALSKSGKLLVESSLIPYAAVLPKDEDPESFFSSEKQYSKWISDNKQDFVSWYSNKLFDAIGEDPNLKNDAINEITSC